MFDLFEKLPILKRMARSRYLQFILVFPTLIFFLIFLLAGLLGTPVGNKNIIVVFVWILWWVLLIGFMVPFASRIWCLVCPFPIIGEWFQRRAFIKARRGDNIPGLKNKCFGLNKPWPKKYRNIWLQNIGFLALAVFSSFLVTRPIVSVVVLGGLFVVSTIMAFIFRQRAFCMYICPVSGFLGLYSMTSKLALRAKDVSLCNRIKSGEEFNFDYGIAACRLSCPAGVDASSYVALIREGRYDEALEVVRDVMPFAGVVGRVCTHACETECVRKDIDKPLSICRLKRFIADRGGYENMQPRKKFVKRYDEKVAVVGSGPAGLTCAYHLSRKGYETTVYESLPVAGGMLRVGIPDYKLPKEVVDGEVDFVRNCGVNILTNTAVGKDISFQELRQQYQAVFVAMGASRSRRLKIEGEDLEGVYNAIDLLQKINLGEKPRLGKRVVVIGGGDTAVDVARSAVRLGSSEVSLVYRRSRDEMPALKKEIAYAEEEGVRISLLTSPLKIVGSDGRATSLLCVKMRLGQPDESGRPRPLDIKGSEHLISADSVIVATGQYSDTGFLPEELSISSAGTIIVDSQTMQTNIPGVFSGGDVVTGPDVLVYAIGAGRRAALAIDRYLQGESMRSISLYPSERRVEEVPIGAIELEERVEPYILPPEERKNNFQEEELPFTENMALREAERCLSCGICGECYRGNEKGWGCPWFQKTGGMDRNNYCGLCMECVKSCPHDNVGVYWRPFAADKEIKSYGEAWKSFIMMVLAVVYSINLLGPWGGIKDLANFTETGKWAGFIFLSLNTLLWCVVIFPLLHYLFCKWAKFLSRAPDVGTKDLFVKYSYAFVPLGLMAWISFSVPLVMINGAYILSVLSDPFGWGWNLFGTAGVHWHPILPHWVPYIQVPLLLAGLFYSLTSLYKIGRKLFAKKRQAVRSLVPMAILLSAITIFLLRLYAG